MSLGAAFALAACGTKAALPGVYKPPAGPVPCSQGMRPIALPAEFPVSFPLPRGTYLASRSQSHPGVTINGLIPVSSFDATVRDLTNTLSQAGFQAAEQDAEPPRDAEAFFTGNGFIGKWKVHSVDGCKRFYSLTVFVDRSG